jgi:lipoprotein
MRKCIFVFIALFLILSCNSQENNSITDTTTFNTGSLKGKVKSLKETIYEIDKNQNKTLFITEEERPYKVFLTKEEMWWKMNNIILKEKFF